MQKWGIPTCKKHADVQDAIALGILVLKDVPTDVIRILGKDIGEIIGSLTNDILEQSTGNDYIATSERIYDSIGVLYKFSRDKIYKCNVIERQRPIVEHIVKSLFDSLTEAMIDTERGQNKRKRGKYKAVLRTRTCSSFSTAWDTKKRKGSKE